MTAIFEATLPVESGALKIRGPQHSGDKGCRISAVQSYSTDYGAELNIDQLDALISTLQALRHTMRK